MYYKGVPKFQPITDQRNVQRSVLNKISIERNFK